MRNLLIIFLLFISLLYSQSGIVINEFMAQNILAVPDDFGDYDDWIEIYNSSNDAIDIAGYFISDDADNLLKWQLPFHDSRTRIPAKGFLLLWADGQLDQGVYHLPFNIGEDETLFLTSDDGKTILDEINIINPEYDVSYGRSPDGTNNWGYILILFSGIIGHSTGIFLIG